MPRSERTEAAILLVSFVIVITMWIWAPPLLQHMNLIPIEEGKHGTN